MIVDKIFVIMSGGLTIDGHLPDYVIDRCEWVINACNNSNLGKNVTILCSSSFSLNIPPKLNKDKFVLSESSMIYKYLKERGLTNQILCEQFSHDTVGSIFFSVDLFALPMKAKSITFITSCFHSKRTEVIVNLMRSIYPEQIHIDTIGVSFPERLNDSVTVNNRCQHEKQAIIRFNALYKKIKNRSEFLEILLNEHSNYNYLYKGRTAGLDELY